MKHVSSLAIGSFGSNSIFNTSSIKYLFILAKRSRDMQEQQILVHVCNFDPLKLQSARILLCKLPTARERILLVVCYGKNSDRCWNACRHS